MTDKKWRHSLAFAFAAIITAVVIARACIISFTDDECLTYFLFIRRDWSEFFEGSSLQTNNHLLNTVLAKLLYTFFGNEEWILRLPNILFFIVYAFFSFRIPETFCENKRIVLPGFLALTTIPFLLDFFSVCRGYGIALGCIMAAIYYLLFGLKNDLRLSSLWAGALFLLLGILSNFTLIYFAIVVFVFISFFVFAATGKKTGTGQKLPFLLKQFFPWMLLFLICVKYMTFILSTGALEAFASKKGFWEEDLDPLIFSLFHRGRPWVAFIIYCFKTLSVLLVVLSFVYSLFHILIKKAFSAAAFFSLTFVCFCLLSVCLNRFFEIAFPPVRALTFLLPHFLLAVLFLLDENRKRFPKIAAFTGNLFFIFMGAGAVISFSLTINTTWPHTSKTKEIVAYMSKDGKEKLVLTTFSYQPSLYYYAEKFKMKNLKIARISSVSEAGNNFSYLLLDHLNPGNTPDLEKYELHGWENINTRFYRNKDFDPLDCRRIEMKENFSTAEKGIRFNFPPVPAKKNDGKLACVIQENNEYSDRIEFTVDSSMTKDVFICTHFTLNIYSRIANPQAMLITENMRNGSLVTWNPHFFYWNEVKKCEWTGIESVVALDGGLKPGDKIRTYLYYRDKDSLWIDNMKLDVRIYKK